MSATLRKKKTGLIIRIAVHQLSQAAATPVVMCLFGQKLIVLMSPKEPQDRPRQVLGTHSLSLLQPNQVHEGHGLLEFYFSQITSIQSTVIGENSQNYSKSCHIIMAKKKLASNCPIISAASSINLMPRSQVTFCALYLRARVSQEKRFEIRINKYVVQGCCTQTTCLFALLHHLIQVQKTIHRKHRKQAAQRLKFKAEAWPCTKPAPASSHQSIPLGMRFCCVVKENQI